MPNKGPDVRNQATEPKAVSSPQQPSAARVAGVGVKVSVAKVATKDNMTPTPPPEVERPELLGSLTTEQQQRTSARVIKKLKLEPVADKDKRVGKRDAADETQECETANKMEDKDLKFPTVKQRMPKALWSTEEKNYFFEALNEYGKDFDAITAYICAKMKKKGMVECNLKTKTQVSHFYYRTWHKLSKHVQFGENVKKVAQELYALINYGELRRKLVAVSEKTCARLGELVGSGALVVRAGGRNRRVRTPACRALRKLNHITERWCGVICPRPAVCLAARDAAAWARVQAAAHNPRLLVLAPPAARLATLLTQLARRWHSHAGITSSRKRESPPMESERCEGSNGRESGETESRLRMETDRVILREESLPTTPVLHVGPTAGRGVHLPAVLPSEPLSSHTISFASYLERMAHTDSTSHEKIRTPKRQRKDSTHDKEKEVEPKKLKVMESVPGGGGGLMNIEETAIDGIELMASYRHLQDPATDDEKELKSEETAEEETDAPPDRDRDMSEREMDLSEMEEEGNKSDSDVESDHKERKFSNLKVKFRIRPKKRGGSLYSVVLDKEQDEVKRELDESKNSAEDGKRNQEDKTDAKSTHDYVKSTHEDVKSTNEDNEDMKSDIDVEFAMKQIRKGWSIYDCGDLTIGDLYLMFGSRSKLELDYWWAEPTPPLPARDRERDRDRGEKEKAVERESCEEPERRESDGEIFSPRTVSQDSNDGLSGDDRKGSSLGEQQSSPERRVSHGALQLARKLINRPTPQPTAGHANSTAVLSDRLKRLLALAGNPYVSIPTGGPAVGRCDCGHVCAHRKLGQSQPQPQPVCGLGPGPLLVPASSGAGDGAATAAAGEGFCAEPAAAVFRHPAPIAPRPVLDTDAVPPPLNLSDVPRWRRGRPRLAASERPAGSRAHGRVVVQRLLPLLPKLPPPSNLIPVKIAPESPPPRILPKPPPTSTSDLSFFYVLSESNGQFYFHDGDRRIPISPINTKTEQKEEELKEELLEAGEEAMEPEAAPAPVPTLAGGSGPGAAAGGEPADGDTAGFLPLETLSLSPSRLLSDGWPSTADHDFSLSSFLGHLESRHHADLATESQLQSLLAESSVDYVAKFADLAAEVTAEATPEVAEVTPKDEVG